MPKSAKATKPEPQKQNLIKLHVNNLSRAEYECTTYRAIAPAGSTSKDYLTPSFWAHVAKTLKHYDIIEIIDEPATYYARVIVTSTGPVWAKVVEIENIPLQKSAEESAKKSTDQTPKQQPVFTITWAGAKAKYRVIRTEDDKVAKDGFNSREEAQTWASQQERALSK